MGQIVDGNRKVQLGRTFSGAAPGGDNAVHKFDVRVGAKKTLQMSVYPRDAETTLANMATVREHLGVNVSDAIRIALHMTANAIRANKAQVEVPSDSR